MPDKTFLVTVSVVDIFILFSPKSVLIEVAKFRGATREYSLLSVRIVSKRG